MHEQYEITPDSLRLETERESLTYVLSHAELTEQELSEVSGRLAFIENELLELFIEKLPS